MEQGGFNVREWSANSKVFMNSINVVDRCDKNPIKVLGVNWNNEKDTLILSPNLGEQSRGL